jgi:hypothetical protein
MKSLIKLFHRTINDYGFYNFLKIIIFEIIFFRLNSNLITNNFSKNFNKNNVEYAPTPYYLLYLVKKNINKINEFNIIDFGCGKVRVKNYILSSKKIYIGIDIVDEYKKYFKTRENLQQGIFFKIDCRNIDLLEKTIQPYNKKKKILYFFNPFEDDLVIKICKKFMNKADIAVLINLYNQDCIKNFKIIYSKQFKASHKSINIIKLKN